MPQILGRKEFTFWIPFELRPCTGSGDLLGFRVLQLGFLVLLGWTIRTCVALNMTDGELLLHYTSVVTESNSVFHQSMLQLEDSNQLHVSPLQGLYKWPLKCFGSQSSQQMPSFLCERQEQILQRYTARISSFTGSSVWRMVQMSWPAKHISRNIAGVWQHTIRRSLCETGFVVVFSPSTSLLKTLVCKSSQFENHGITSRNTIAKESQVLNVIQKPQGDKRLSQQQSTLPHVRVQGAALCLATFWSLLFHIQETFLNLCSSQALLVRLPQVPGKILLCFGFDTLFILLVNASRMLRRGTLKLGKWQSVSC